MQYFINVLRLKQRAFWHYLKNAGKGAISNLTPLTRGDYYKFTRGLLNTSFPTSEPYWQLGCTNKHHYSCVIGYSLESLCVCVCVRPCLCVCVCFCTITQKKNRSRNTKSEYIVVSENSSDEFDIELHRTKVKVTVGVQKFSPFTTIQTVRSYSSTLVQARNLILSIYLHLIIIYKINQCRHA